MFSLGIASGEPLPDSVVLWTRLAPDPLNGGGMPNRYVAVKWEVATDDSFRHVVRRGTALAAPENGHAVHVDVRGLKPGREYAYRFRAGADISSIGRTLTAPPPGRHAELRFVFASCQNWKDGFWPAWGHAASQYPDLVVHLGDYIYESGQDPTAIRDHNGPEVKSLHDYRNRYALYKSDLLLQIAHAIAPWIVTWDDHEVENNYAGLDPQDPADAPTFAARVERWRTRPGGSTRPSGCRHPQVPTSRSTVPSTGAGSPGSTFSTGASTAPINRAAVRTSALPVRNERLPTGRCSALRSSAGWAAACAGRERRGTCSPTRW